VSLLPSLLPLRRHPERSEGSHPRSATQAIPQFTIAPLSAAQFPQPVRTAPTRHDSAAPKRRANRIARQSPFAPAVAVASEFAFQFLSVILSAAKDLLQMPWPLTPHWTSIFRVPQPSRRVRRVGPVAVAFAVALALPGNPARQRRTLKPRESRRSSDAVRARHCLHLVSASVVIPAEARALFASPRGISPPLFALARRSLLRCSPSRHQARHDQNESRPRREAQRNFPSPKAGVSPARQRRTLKPRESRRSSDAVRARLCGCLRLVSPSVVIPAEAPALFASPRRISPPLFAIAPSGATRPERIATAPRSAAQFPQPESW
jgi:hypothetical protein